MALSALTSSGVVTILASAGGIGPLWFARVRGHHPRRPLMGQFETGIPRHPEPPSSSDATRPTGVCRIGRRALAVALGGASPAIVVSLGGLVGQSLAPTKELATFPVSLLNLGLALGTIPAAMLMRSRAGDCWACAPAPTTALSRMAVVRARRGDGTE